MQTVSEHFERLLRLGICEDTPDNRALFATGFSTVLIALLMAQPRQRNKIRSRLWEEVDEFIRNAEYNSPVVRQRFNEIRQIVAAET